MNRWARGQPRLCHSRPQLWCRSWNARIFSAPWCDLLVNCRQPGGLQLPQQTSLTVHSSGSFPRFPLRFPLSVATVRMRMKAPRQGLCLLLCLLKEAVGFLRAGPPALLARPGHTGHFQAGRSSNTSAETPNEEMSEWHPQVTFCV